MKTFKEVLLEASKGVEDINKKAYLKTKKQLSSGWESEATNAPHENLFKDARHHIIGHGDSDGLDQGYVHKHPSGHGQTTVDTSKPIISAETIKRDVKNQNPHLSSTDVGVAAFHIHKDLNKRFGI